jgi:excisionase family DNA binding protein
MTRTISEEPMSTRMTHMATQSKPADPVDLADRRLLRIEEVADRLAVSRSMAWKLVTEGQLRSVRIGRAVRVRPADLEAYIVGAVREG